MSTLYSGDSRLLSKKPAVLLAVSLLLYAILYFYHGFIAFGRDTIETLPYALWMSDHTLFSGDFHVQNLSGIWPNERWTLSYMLHFFPNQLYGASRVFHFIFTLSLIGGMIRFSDLLLRNIEWSVLAVFVTLLTMYNINVGSNELYYNMFVPSLAAKGIAIWALVFFWEKRYLLTSIVLAVSCFLHPLVGLQLFVILTCVIVYLQFLSAKKVDKDKGWWTLFPIFILTAGVWIVCILWAQGPKVDGALRFSDIVQFRIAHHFIPSYFPKNHMAIHVVLYLVAFVQFWKKSKRTFYFMLIALLGIAVYVIGLMLDYEVILLSQWMKINVWLKFLGIIGLLQLIQTNVETRYSRVVVYSLYIVALLLAIYRFQPQYDKPFHENLYGWITVNTDKDDVFLVPPELVDFKVQTHRSSYFDFKAMLHHRPEIYEWARRFEEIYGLTIDDRSPTDNIFAKVYDAYGSGPNVLAISSIDYLVIRVGRQESALEKQLLEHGIIPVFLSDQYKVYEREAK